MSNVSKEVFFKNLKGLVHLSETGSKVELQTKIEELYSKRNLHKLIRAEIASEEDIQASLYTCARVIEDWITLDEYESKNMEKQRLIGVDLEEMLLDMMVVLMQQDFHYFELTTVVAGCLACTPFGKINPDLDDNEIKAYKRGIKCTAAILVHMAECDLIDIIPAYRSSTGTVCISMPFSFDGDTGEAIQRAKFLPPMVCKPKKLTKNTQSAYQTFDSHRITKRLQRHNDDICLDVLNLVNSTPYTLNLDVLEQLTDDFEPKDEEYYAKKGKKPISIGKQQALFDAHVESTQRTCAELINLGNEFYFEWFYCYRGRMYDRGYELHIQGTSFKKSMLDFKEPMPIDGWQMYANEFDFEVPEDFDYSQAELDAAHEDLPWDESQTTSDVQDDNEGEVPSF